MEKVKLEFAVSEINETSESEIVKDRDQIQNDSGQKDES